MAFETQAFGDGSAAGSGNVTFSVSTHYNARVTGGEQGRFKTEGNEFQSAMDFSATGPLHDTQSVPAGAVVTDVRGYGLTGSISTATVGTTDISAARDDDDGTWVTIATAGDLAVTGPTAGTVVVKWRRVP